MIRFGFTLALACALSGPAASATQSATFAKQLNFEGQEYVLVTTGQMKARALLAKITLCHFAKYATSDQQRMIAFQFARDLSAAQLQQVFRGIVQGQSGYTRLQLDEFLALLPAAKNGSVLHLRFGAKGTVDVFADRTHRGSVEAPQLAAAIWSQLGPDTAEALPNKRLQPSDQ